MIKNSVLVALVVGVLIAFETAVEYYLSLQYVDLGGYQYFVYLRFPLLFLGVFFAVYFRGKTEDVSYFRLVLDGVLNGLIITLVVVSFHAVYHSVININFYEELKELHVNSIKNSSFLEEQQRLKEIKITHYLETKKWIMTPLGSASFYFLEMMLTVLIFSGVMPLLFMVFNKKNS